MLKETADFIKQNKDLINDNDWDTIYNKLKSYNKNNNFLNISMMIDFTKVLLDSGINLGIDYNQLNSDLSILKNLNSEHFSSPSTVKEDDQMCLYDETMAKSLTNVLRSCRVLDENDSIPGGPMDYNTLSIYIIGVHDKEVIKDVFEHSYGNYWFDIAIQLTSKNNKFLSFLYLQMINFVV